MNKCQLTDLNLEGNRLSDQVSAAIQEALPGYYPQDQQYCTMIAKHVHTVAIVVVRVGVVVVLASLSDNVDTIATPVLNLIVNAASMTGASGVCPFVVPLAFMCNQKKDNVSPSLC